MRMRLNGISISGYRHFPNFINGKRKKKEMKDWRREREEFRRIEEISIRRGRRRREEKDWEDLRKEWRKSGIHSYLFLHSNYEIMVEIRVKYK